MIFWGSMLPAAVILGGWGSFYIARRHRWGGKVELGLPQPFGFNMAWLAVKTRDTALLIEALGLKAVKPAHWAAGVAAIYNAPHNLRDVFVAPPVEGWSLVAGLSLPMPMGPAFEDTCTRVLVELSEEFSDVQLFVACPDIPYFCWVRMSDGELRRGFASGPEGVIWNRGGLTACERELGIELFDIQKVDPCDDARQALDVGAWHVSEMTQRWSIDPTSIDERAGAEAGSGYLGRAPRSWQPALKARTAA